MVPFRRLSILALVISLLFLALMRAPDIVASVQTGFLLDLDSPSFSYQEGMFSDSSHSREHDFTGSGDSFSLGVNVSRNSTVGTFGLGLTGKIQYIYQESINNPGLLGVSIGNITTNPGNEIVTGSSKGSGTSNVYALSGQDASVIWTYNLSSQNNDVFSTDTGNVTSFSGDEVVFGAENNRVYVLEVTDSGASEAWSYLTSADVKAVRIANLTGNGDNYVIAGADKVYILDYQGSLVCNSSVMTVNGLDAGNLTSDPGQEIAVATGSFVRIVNSSCATVLSKNLGAGGVSSIAVGNVTMSPYDEVAFGGADYSVYLMNSSLSHLWNYTTQDDVRSVTIGDVVGQTAGNEVVAGSNDKRVYTLSGSGALIWDYMAESYIETVAVGNLTSDLGNEVVAGAGDGNLYAFNFDYFPTDLQIDVGENGTVDWEYAGSLRTSTTTSGLAGAVEYYVNSVCQQDMCSVPLYINSSRAGKLNVTSITAEYSYNASSIVDYTTLAGEWSRTSGIQVNESVGNESRNVSFTGNPGQDIVVAYIKIPGGETRCDFNGTSYSTLAVGADNACNVANFTVSSSGGLPSSFLFWDSSMSVGVPVEGSEGAYWYTNTTDDFRARRNLTIFNNTQSTFYDIYANTTTGDPSIRGEYFLNVTWNGQACNITPPSENAACDTGSPVYSSLDCGGDSFEVCMEGSFFRWIQPYSDSGVTYTAGGSTNLRPFGENPNATLNHSYWGDQFNYSIRINDTEGDETNVTLYYWLYGTDTWYSGGTTTVSDGNGTAWFNITSSQGWIGANKYFFSYQDFNSSGYPLHSLTNTSEASGPLVRKRYTSTGYVSGNESNVNRTESTPLVARVADSDEGGFIDAGASCRLWVTRNGTSYDSGMSNLTDSSGYCRFWFTPDGNYSAGEQLWRAGIRGDSNYNDSETTEYLVINIMGAVNISITRPYGARKIMKNTTNHLEGRLVDEYGEYANQSGFNCSFWFDGAYLGSNDTEGDGRCHYYWVPSCAYSRGSHYMNITISNENGPYSIRNPEDSRSVYVYDRLNVTVTGPEEYSISNKGESIDLSSSVNDTCELAGPGDYTVSWYLKRKRTLDLLVRKEGGYDEETFPVIVNSTWLESRDIDLWDWPMNSTRVFQDGSEVPSRVNPWNDSIKSSMNWSQEYFGEHSELVFLATQSEWQNLSYTILYNQSSEPGTFTYIENGGFESGSVLPWDCFGSNSSTGAWSRDVCDGSYCACEARDIEENGTLYLSSDFNGGSESVQGARFYAGRELGYDRIRVGFNATGEFDNSTGDAYLRVYAGNGSCDLDFSRKGVWREQVCYNESFSEATWINITIHDYGFGGGGLVDSSHVNIDYICLADESGECVNPHSGFSHSLTATSEDLLGTGEDSSWSIPVTEPLGMRNIIANVSGTYYTPDRDSQYMYMYGWSGIALGNLSSTNCTFDESWECMKNASLDIFCYVFDANTSRYVEGHNMTFWGAGEYLGSNTTDSGGRALFHWVNSSDIEDNHTITCNITDDSNVFYNDTSNNTASTFFLVRSGNTNASLDLNLVPSSQAENLSRELNRSYTLYVNLTNIGDTEGMYNIQVRISTEEGVYAGDVTCGTGSLLPHTGCNMTSMVNVSYLATEGYKPLDVNVTWLNADTTQDNVSDTRGITVVNSTILSISEDYLNYTMPRGGSSFQAGTFIIQSYGNTDLRDTELNVSGGDSGNVSQWVSFSPSSVPVIAHDGQQAVDVYLTVPNNVSERTYVTNITANATGSFCSPAGLCQDALEFRVNVTVHDWSVSDTYANKTIGLMPFNGTIDSILVTNNKEDEWTFNVSVFSLNTTSYIRTGISEFSVPAGSYYSLRIYHNSTTDYLPGFYTSNIVITNKENAVPYSRNITVDLQVINLSIWIFSPNQTSPTSPLYAGDKINLTVNATLSGDPDTLEGNMTWSVELGGSACTGLQSSYSNFTGLWSMNCTAPSIPGNPIYNDLELTGVYTPEDAVLTVTEEDAVRYVDVAPPSINSIWVWGADAEGNVEYGTKSEIVVRANISDNIMVQGASADVHFNGQNQSTTEMYNITPYVWTFNFSSPMDAGDYQIIINATDPAGNSNRTNGTLLGLFDIYQPINLNGSLRDKDGNPMGVTMSLYKNNTQWRIHQFSTNGTGHYKWVCHKRVYDMRLEFSDQEVVLYGVDLNASAVDQWNLSDPRNLTNPMSLDYFTINSSDITNVVLPSGATNKLMAVAIEKNLSRVNSSILFTLDYGEALSEMTPGERADLTENNFGVYRCSDWDMSTRTCSGGNFENASIETTVNASADTISFTTSGTSAYVVAEWEGTADGDGDEDDDGSQDTGGSSGSSSSPSTGTVTPSTTLPFEITTSIGNIHIHPGENKSYFFSVRNKLSSNLSVGVDVEGLGDYIIPEFSTLELDYNETRSMDIMVEVPENMGTGTYTGSIVVSSGTRSQEIPVSMTVSIVATELLSLGINILTPNINPGGKLRFAVDVRNLGLPPGFNVSMKYFIKESERELIIEEDEETIFLEDSKVFTKSMGMDEPGLKVGQYYLEIWAYFADGRSVNSVAVFNLVEPYWSSWEGRMILMGIAMVGMAVIGYYFYKKYRLWKREKSRYIFPLDYKKLPQEGPDAFWLGKIAESSNKAWFNPPDLTTHLLVAGSTGAGKSVSASVFVEEALEKKIPVVAFDPTAQWTGFVKALEDDNLRKYYPDFGMDPKSVKPYKGMIFEVTDPQELKKALSEGFDRYLNPGEITVFTLDKLKPGQYDEAVSIIIESMFGRTWEESTTLKVMVVFDEVHRLLEKYGGKGGYVALEKAAREFRKWGIGMVMCSQVLADFKEAIAGNVLTEIQLNTKSMTDIQKVATKYGEEYSKKISRQGVGVGMLQNPKYNDGKPYFVHFRPTLHNPHKISAEDMELYKKFAKRLEKVEATIAQMKKSGRDTFDIELELRLAKDKLKQGRFRMAQIYISSLEQNLNIKSGD